MLLRPSATDIKTLCSPQELAAGTPFVQDWETHIFGVLVDCFI